MRIAPLQFLGILIMLNALPIAWFFSTKYPFKVVSTLTVIAIGTGYLMLMADRITEAKMPFLGSFKAKAEQALVDAETVSKLRERVEAQAATVDLVAKQATDAKNLSEEAAAKIAELDKTIEAGKKAQQDLEILTDFQRTVQAAQNDDSAAYVRLGELATTPNYPYVQDAMRAYQKIMDDHLLFMDMGYDLTQIVKSPNPQSLDIKGIIQLYSSSPNPTTRIAILQFVRTKTDISKFERMSFFVLALHDPSLNVAAQAGKQFTMDSNDSFKPLALQAHILWWSQHSGEIK